MTAEVNDRHTLEATSKLAAALHLFAQETNLTHPLRHMIAFLEVAKADLSNEQFIAGHKGIPLSDLAKRAGAESSAITRIVQELGQITRKGTQGHGLVQALPLPPPHGTIKPVTLTSKGRRLAARLAAILNK